MYEVRTHRVRGVSLLVACLASSVLAGCTGPEASRPALSSQQPSAAANSGGDDSSAQLGICRTDAPDTVCTLVGPSGHQVQIAVVRLARSGPVRLLLPGGPGLDVTRSASFEYGTFGTGAGTLVVLGEPASLTMPTADCNTDLQRYARELMTDATRSDEGDALAASCIGELRDLSWSTELLADVDAFIVRHSVTEVIGASFGARMFEALADRQFMQKVSRVVLVAPAPSGRVSSLSRVVSSRAARTRALVCPSAEGICEKPAIMKSATSYFMALMNAAYAWDTNAKILRSMLAADTSSTERGLLDAARAFSFVDPTGSADPQLLEYLAIQCTAYDTTEKLSVGSDSEFEQALAGLLAACPSIARALPPLPTADVSGHRLDVCVAYSAADPISGRY